MKKLLILIVSVAIYLHFYPNPALTEFYQDKKNQLLNKMSQSSKVTFKKKMNNIYKEIKAEYVGFSATELAKLKDITQSVESIEQFNEEYCIKGKKNKNFHPDHIDKICLKTTSFLQSL